MTTTHPDLTANRSETTTRPVPTPHLVGVNLRRSEVGPLAQQLEVVPWSDADLAETGHDPRGEYVERFWLGLLGPSTTWLVRRFARGLEECPNGFRVDLAETGRALGLGDSVARNSSLQRSLLRACQFDAAHRVSDSRLAVRLQLPPLSRRQLSRLPQSLQLSHAHWQERSRSRDTERVALAAAKGLAETGEPLGVVERQLVAWGISAPIAREAALQAFGH